MVKEFGLAYDCDGLKGREGNLNEDLFARLNELEFYSIDGPKSLGAEFLDEVFFPVLDSYEIATVDKLTTVYHHIAFHIAKFIHSDKVLLTGGGAHNSYLFELLQQYSGYEFQKASDDIINFKEAIIFAYMGYLRAHNQENVNSLVTGAKKSNIGGAIYLS